MNLQVGRALNPQPKIVNARHAPCTLSAEALGTQIQILQPQTRERTL